MSLPAAVLAVIMFVAGWINGLAEHWDASALDMIACALFWGLARVENILGLGARGEWAGANEGDEVKRRLWPLVDIAWILGFYAWICAQAAWERMRGRA